MHFLRVLPYLPMGGIVPKSSYPNSKSTPQTVSSLEGYLVLSLIWIHQITEELHSTVTTVFTLFQCFFENEETDIFLDSVI